MNNDAVVVFKMARSESGQEAGAWENWGPLPLTAGGAVTMTASSSAISISRASRITVDPEIRGGVPCIGTSQVPLALVLRYLAAGWEPQAIVEALPGLSLADIRSALSGAAWVMREPLIDWQTIDLPSMMDLQDEMSAWEAASDKALANIEEVNDAGA